MVVAAYPGEADRKFAGEIGANDGHTQSERASHNRRKCAGILVNGEGINRQCGQSLAAYKNFPVPSTASTSTKSRLKAKNGEPGAAANAPVVALI